MFSFNEMIMRINDLSLKYDESDNLNSSMIAKLAILEASGWIEEFFDEKWKELIINLKCNKDYKDHLDKLIELNYGFEFDKNLQKIMIQLIGIYGISCFEKNNSEVYFNLKSSLNNIYTNRNKVAHTYLKSDDKVLLAPNALLKNFCDVYNCSIKYFDWCKDYLTNNV